MITKHCLQRCKDGFLSEQGYIRHAVQYFQVDGIQGCHCQYTGKQGLHLAFGLQQTGYQPRKTSGKERHECTDKRVSIHCEYGRYRTSGCKAPVNRQIGNIQNAEGNKHPQRHDGKYHAEYHRILYG